LEILDESDFWWEQLCRTTLLVAGVWPMFEPHLAETDPRTEKIYPQTVVCPQHKCEVEIVVAAWPNSEEGWSDWRVIDCWLLAPGAVRCGMDCLSQARLEGE